MHRARAHPGRVAQVKIRQVTDPIYGEAFVLVCATRAELATSRHPVVRHIGPLPTGMLGRYVALELANGCPAHLVFLDRTRGAERTMALWHEAFHATAAALRNRGVVLSEGSEEAYAYYLSWVGAELTKTLQAA